jgi:4-nitrophenyl phosphatase
MIRNDISVLRSKKLFVLDMDGTFYLGNRILEGSLGFIQTIRQSGKEFLFFTNNASRTASFYMDKLSRMGCSVQERNIVTAGDVTIRYLSENHPGKKVYLLGTQLLEESFRSGGIKLVEEASDIVVVSFDLTLTYEKVSRACKYIREGAKFIATHMDFNCPIEDGFIPDCGSICAMVTASTGVKPRFLGKPFGETVEMIMGMTGYSRDDMAIIGDRLYTDIATGVNNGVTSILVLTGETRQEDIERSQVKPDFVFPSLGDIAGVLQKKGMP